MAGYTNMYKGTHLLHPGLQEPRLKRGDSRSKEKNERGPRERVEDSRIQRLVHARPRALRAGTSLDSPSVNESVFGLD